ncbi:type II toxin-antitoxin system RelE/ParE family toxin [candidate division KSB1 bacterium]|nr:type II toxin-antitoxin system RelE/ParE family toxin [candidate division KSB1 bacterium]
MIASYRVRVARLAKADLRGILDYIAADRPAAADRLERRVAERLKSLRHNPERFPKIRENFHTKLVYRHILVNSYRIIFRIFGTEVLVVRIIHQARRFTFDMLFGLD